MTDISKQGGGPIWNEILRVGGASNLQGEQTPETPWSPMQGLFFPYEHLNVQTIKNEVMK